MEEREGLIEMTFQRNIRHQLIKFKIILDLFNSGDSDVEFIFKEAAKTERDPVFNMSEVLMVSSKQKLMVSQ